MNSSYICASCRRALGQPRPRKAPQWQTRASFISLSNRPPRNTTDKPSGDDPVRTRGEFEANAQAARLQREKQRRKATGGGKFAGDTLESLFQETLYPPTPTAKTQTQPSTVLDLYKNVDTLRKMLLEGGNVADAWLFFVEHFGPDAEKHPFDKSIVSRALLKDVIMAKRKYPLSQHLPSVTEVSTISYQLGLLNGADWGNMVVDLIENILILQQRPAQSAEEEERLAADLIGAWNVVCRPEGNLKDLPTYESTSLNWSHLPRIGAQSAIKAYRHHGPQKCFSLLTPSFNARQANIIPLIAAATFKLFTERAKASIVFTDSVPLETILANVIRTPDLNIEYLVNSPERSATKVICDYIATDWARLKDTAENLITSQIAQDQKVKEDDLTARIEFRHPVEKKTQANIQNMRSKLDKSVREQDANQTDKLWQIASQWPIRPVSEKGEKKHRGGVLTLFLLNKFIFSYMALRHPNRAIEVWNTMVKNGIRPASSTWTAMLSGARTCRDANALNQIWAQMRASKVELTREAWTARIAGLIECWKVDDGLRALDEMGRIWLAEATIKYPKFIPEELLRLEEAMVKGVTKPSIETVNMTISALMRKGKRDVVSSVLAWAARFGIAPSAFTYNTLLRPLIRAGDRIAATKLITEMEVAGVPPDAGTFVTIIDETLRESESYTMEEQQAAIDSIFDEIEALGLEITKGLYGHIIHGLLEGLIKSGSRDMSVVNTVMSRMAKQGWQPDSVEYTEIVRFHFDQDPPDLAAVDELIQRSAMNPKALSHIFWDRVLEGYSRAGETVKALAVYKDIRQRNRVVDTSKVAWRAVQELVLALVRNGEWEVAKGLVRQKVADSGGALPKEHDVRVGGQHSQFAFWEVVRDLGLLEEDGASKE